ncbi:MAG: FecR domain-containing protein [Planctomycetota bacterium]|nr:FecR domain-containing protein [Planctomycetota bacterium]
MGQDVAQPASLVPSTAAQFITFGTISEADRCNVQVGDLVSADSPIIVQPQGQVVIAVNDGSTLYVNGASELRAEALGSWRLSAGGLDVHAAKQESGQRLVVNTPHGSATVQGTRFTTRVFDDHSIVAVREGQVLVRKQQEPSGALIGPGEQARVDAFSAVQVSHTRPILAAPLRGQNLLPSDGPVITQHGGSFGPNGLTFDGTNRLEISPTGDLAHAEQGSYSVVISYRPERLPSGSVFTDNDGKFFLIGRRGLHTGLVYEHSGSFGMISFIDEEPGHHVGTSTDASYPPGHWYHLIGVVDRDRGLTQIYLDGTQVAEESWQPRSPSALYKAEKPWLVGMGGPPDTTQYRWGAVGTLRDMAVYDRALSASEAQELAAQAELSK